MSIVFMNSTVTLILFLCSADKLGALEEMMPCHHSKKGKVGTGLLPVAMHNDDSVEFKVVGLAVDCSWFHGIFLADPLEIAHTQ
jgi:hypothetical protein